MSDSREKKIKHNPSNVLAETFIVGDDGPRSGGLVSAWTYATSDGTSSADFGTLELDSVATTYRDGGSTANPTSFSYPVNARVGTPKSLFRVHGGTLTVTDIVFASNPASFDLRFTVPDGTTTVVQVTAGSSLAITVANAVAAVQANLTVRRWVYVEHQSDTTLHFESKREIFNALSVVATVRGTANALSEATHTRAVGDYGNACLQTNCIEDLGSFTSTARDDVSINDSVVRSARGSAGRTNASGKSLVTTGDIASTGVNRIAQYDISASDLAALGDRRTASLPMGFVNQLVGGSDAVVTSCFAVVTEAFATATAATAATTSFNFASKPATGAEITLVSTDGTSKTYIFAASGTTGTLDSSSKIRVVAGDTTAATSAAQLKIAIDDATNGHTASKLTVAVNAVTSGDVDITQVTTGTAGNTAITTNAAFDAACGRNVVSNFVGGRDVASSASTLAVQVHDRNLAASTVPVFGAYSLSAVGTPGLSGAPGTRKTETFSLALNNSGTSPTTFYSSWISVPENSHIARVSVQNLEPLAALDLNTSGDVKFQVEKFTSTAWHTVGGGGTSDVVFATSPSDLRPTWASSQHGTNPVDLHSSVQGGSNGFCPRDTRVRVSATVSNKAQLSGGGAFDVQVAVDFVSEIQASSSPVEVSPRQVVGDIAINLSLVDESTYYNTGSTDRFFRDLSGGAASIFVRYYNRSLNPYAVGSDTLPKQFMATTIDASAMNSTDVLRLTVKDAGGSTIATYSGSPGTAFGVNPSSNIETAMNIVQWIAGSPQSRSVPSDHFSAFAFRSVSADTLNLMLLNTALVNTTVEYIDAAGNPAAGITLPGGGASATFASGGRS